MLMSYGGQPASSESKPEKYVGLGKAQVLVNQAKFEIWLLGQVGTIDRAAGTFHEVPGIIRYIDREQCEDVYPTFL
jgi:hypothetical protein